MNDELCIVLPSRMRSTEGFGRHVRKVNSKVVDPFYKLSGVSMIIVITNVTEIPSPFSMRLKQ